MKLTKVAEALASQDDELILGVKGTLTKLYDPLNGEGEHGPWTIQNGIIKDETGQIKVMFSNRDTVPKNWQGKEIVLQCQKHSRGGWSGVKMGTDKDKKLCLKVTSAAEVFLFDGEQQPEPPQEPPAKAPAKASGSPPEPGTPLSKAIQPEPPQGATDAAENAAVDMPAGIEKLRRIANIQYAAITMVHEYLLPLLLKRGIEIEPIQESKLVQNMLIEAFKANLQSKFPTKELKGPKSTNGT